MSVPVKHVQEHGNANRVVLHEAVGNAWVHGKRLFDKYNLAEVVLHFTRGHDTLKV
jgi:hypothetical protein